MYKAEVCGLSFNYLFLIKTFLFVKEKAPQVTKSWKLIPGRVLEAMS